jgi:hypothetical protein
MLTQATMTRVILSPTVSSMNVALERHSIRIRQNAQTWTTSVVAA